ncbi:MAG: hypothetical protein R2749_29585 [Acidimicrobiales bacterium]
MSGTTWSVLLVKDAVIALLDAATWPGSKPQISFGIPRTIEREAIVVGGTTNSDQDWSLLGGRRRQEDYYLQLWINVEHTTQREATERAVEILGVVETALRATPNLGGVLPVGQWAEIRNPLLTEGPGTESYEAEISFDIHVKARI